MSNLCGDLNNIHKYIPCSRLPNIEEFLEISWSSGGYNSECSWNLQFENACKSKVRFMNFLQNDTVCVDFIEVVEDLDIMVIREYEMLISQKLQTGHTFWWGFKLY